MKLMGDSKKIKIAENRNTPPAILTKLAEDEDKWVRYIVTQNSSTPAEALTQLAEDESEWVRAYVAENLSIPPEVLAKLAEDEQWTVRHMVAENPSAPLGVLTKMIEVEKDDDVTQTVAQNPTYLQYRAEQDGVCERGQQMPVEWLQEMYGKKSQ